MESEFWGRKRWGVFFDYLLVDWVEVEDVEEAGEDSAQRYGDEH